MNDGDDMAILPQERGKRSWTRLCVAVHRFHTPLEPSAKDPHFSGPA